MRCVLLKARAPTGLPVDDEEEESPDTVAPGPQEQAIDAVVSADFLGKACRRAALVLLVKSYVKAHTRRLPSGRTITVEPYFTKRVGKGDAPTQRRPTHAPPPEGVHAPLRPEQLTARLVRHVREGTLTHAEAHANLDHLERRAHAGHHLEHGHGPSWTPEQTHGFIAHARQRLVQHQEEQEEQRREAARQQAEAERKQEEERTKRRERRQRQKERERHALVEEKQQTTPKEEKPSKEKQPWEMTNDEFYQAIDRQSATKFAKTGVSKINPQWRHPVGKLPKAERDEAQQAFQYDPKAMEQYAKARAFGLSHDHAMTVGYEIQGHVDLGTAYQQVRRDQPVQAVMQADYSAIPEHSEHGARIQAERTNNAQYFDTAPPLLQAVLRKVAPLIDVNPPTGPSEGSWYVAQERSIMFHPESRLEHYPDYAGPVWRHEYGHHVDYEMGSRSHCASYQKFKAMEQDRLALTAVGLPDEQRRNERRAVANMLRTSEGTLDRTLALQTWAVQGLTEADLRVLLGEDWDTRSASTHSRLLNAWHHKDARTFLVQSASTGHHGMVQDLIGAVTRNTIDMPWNHSDDYYGAKEHYTQFHSAEAYADWFSTHGSGQPAWSKVLEHFVPNTNKAFTEMTHTWLTTPSG